RSFGQLTLCPRNGTVTGKWRGSHVVGLLTTLNFRDGPDRNKTRTFQATVLGSQMGLKGGAGSVWLQAAGLGLLPASLLWPSLLCHCYVLPPAPGVPLV
ncbi:TMEM219 isoform 9, partial [Pan troglodytes]